MDPCVFVDDDGQAYMYFGGLWGGQLEKWRTGTLDPVGVEPKGTEPTLGPKVARMADDILSFAGPIEEVAIVDQDGQPIPAKDHARRFFEGPWLHKYEGTYYSPNTQRCWMAAAGQRTVNHSSLPGSWGKPPGPTGLAQKCSQ
jgi:beta-xylosidase